MTRENKVKVILTRPAVTQWEGTPPTTKDRYNKEHIVIPYMQGLGESIKNICKRYGIQTHFKENRTIKNILVKPKEYIGETSRTLGERYTEHLKEPLTIYGHSNISGHSTNSVNFTIIGRKDHGLARTIKESIYIRVNNPTLNRNVGKYNFHHIWDRVLFSTPELKINNDNGHAHSTPISGHAQTLPPNRHVHRTKEHPGHAWRTPPSEHVNRTS